jgi:hypothetical protein
MRPLARTNGLVIRELSNETVVYDTTTHRAHCLNRTAALVFRHADGSRSVSDLALLVAGDATDLEEESVGAALEHLSEAGLLMGPAPRASDTSRREVLRQVGLGAVLLAPVVTSLLVPSPAEAAATCIQQAACSSTNIGQSCYVSNPGAECPTKTCQGTNSCL